MSWKQKMESMLHKIKSSKQGDEIETYKNVISELGISDTEIKEVERAAEFTFSLYRPVPPEDVEQLFYEGFMFGWLLSQYEGNFEELYPENMTMSD